jgi:5-methylcytosine-specific restriction endonuclease McrA
MSMNGLQKLEAEEKRQEIFRRDFFLCTHCGLSIFRHGTPQLAHLISQGKANIEKYGEEIIHHPMNTASTCSLYCNSRKNIGMNPEKTKELVQQITDYIIECAR